MGPSGRRSICRDSRPARECYGLGRTIDPAPGQRSHPGSGAGSRRSPTAPRNSRQDRQADVPPRRHVDAGRAGAAGATAAGLRNRLWFGGGALATLSAREAGDRVRRGTHRCAAQLRPAQQRADRHVQVQHRGRAQIRAGHPGECRPDVCNRARRQGDLRSRDPRADPGRQRPDLGQLHRGVRQQSRHSSARRRAAGQAHRDRAARGGRGLGSGFDRERQARVLFWRRARRRLHGGDVRAVWRLRQRRRCRQRGNDLRHFVAAQCNAHVAGHHRHRAHDRHRGRGAVFRRQRAGARLRRDARHRHRDDRLHRLHADAADRGLVGKVGASAATGDFIGGTDVRLYHSIPLLRIVPDDTKFDFMRFRRISFPVSAALSIVAILLFFYHGLNFGIDFVGGTLIEVQSKSGAADLAKMRAALGGLGLGEVQLQEFGGPTNVLIRVAQQPGGEQAQQAAISKVREALGSEVDYRRVEVVGPRVSSELLAKSTIGLGLAIFAILVYLWFRFEWQFALGAMIANVHDLVLTIGYMSLTQIDFDLSSIAALLTILGYSLNDTVVIYDRIREMLRRYKRMSMPDLLNISVNSTLSRSTITHVTVTLALLALLLFGGHAIHSFVATMIFGVVLVGTYTSVFIAAPILIYLGVGTTRMEAEESAEKAKTSTAKS